MERERPDYLPPIEKPRWSFPWLTAIGITVLVLAVFGVKQHLDTQAAWNKRFTKAPATQDATPTRAPIDLKAQARRDAEVAEARLRRVVEDREMEKERESWRCINHIPFRKIDGGWENVVGESC